MSKTPFATKGHWSVDINGIPHSVKHVEAKSPSSRGAATIYKKRFSNLKTGHKLNQSYKGDDVLKEADCARIPLQYSYQDGDRYIFTNTENYIQYGLNGDEIEDQLAYLSDSLEDIFGLLSDDALLGIELPNSVLMKVIETAPSIKGATAAGRTKPATLSCGLAIQVQEYLEQGEIVKVNTTTGRFLSRT